MRTFAKIPVLAAILIAGTAGIALAQTSSSPSAGAGGSPGGGMSSPPVPPGTSSSGGGVTGPDTPSLSGTRSSQPCGGGSTTGLGSSPSNGPGSGPSSSPSSSSISPSNPTTGTNQTSNPPLASSGC